MLLDTQVVLWSVNDDPRLGRRARDLLSEAPELLVSAVTHVELTVKTMLGRLETPPDLPAQLAALGIRPLALEERHVSGLRRFESLVGHDPFDRMLVAQAQVEGDRFLTADRKLLELGEPWIIDATK